MSRRRAFLALVLVFVVLLVPLIPAYRISGSAYAGRLIIGFRNGECDQQMLDSLFYLLTGFGPNIMFNARGECFG